MLYFYPPSDITSDDDVIISVASILINLNYQVNGQNFYNIKFEMNRGTVINTNSGNFTKIENCEISNIGSRAININNCQIGCLINNNVLFNLGHGN
jgi:hypothetical protein